MSSNNNENTNSNLNNVANESEDRGWGRGRHCRHGGGRRAWKIPFIIAIVVAIKSALVLVLWNALVPEAFNGPTLNYLQALELTVLAKILTGFGGGGFRHRFGGGHHHHRGGWGRRWMQMSPEERLKLREEMRARCRR